MTVSCFFFTNMVWGLPAAGLEIIGQAETPGFLRINIPQDLAKIEETYEAPAKVDPELVLHIQNAHGNYEAQLKIKKLMDYLYKTYGFTLFFVEGAVKKVNPDFLRLFPEAERNLAFADLLAKEGELTGAEFFLVDAPPEVEAYGIEQSELYRANYEAFREVYAHKKSNDAFIAALDQKLITVSSHIFSNDLRRVLSEWQKFEAGHRDFLPFVTQLSQDAKTFLDLDLSSLFAQVEWPQLTRLLVLQDMDKDLDIEAGRAQKEEVLNFLRKHRCSDKLIQAIQQLEEKQISMTGLQPEDSRNENLPRYLLERLIEEAGPKGFRFHDYEAFSLYAGYLVLKSELFSKALFEEIELLFEQVIDSLAKEKKEKELVQLFRDKEILRKLLTLELTRRDWDKVTARRDKIEPEEINKRTERFDKKGKAIQMAAVLEKSFKSALKFYEFARQREAVFHYTMKQEMNKRGIDKSGLLTGGFHTEGILEMLRGDETNYGVLMPHVSGEMSFENYIHTMLEDRVPMFDVATMEMNVHAQDNAVRVANSAVPARIVDINGSPLEVDTTLNEFLLFDNLYNVINALYAETSEFPAGATWAVNNWNLSTAFARNRDIFLVISEADERVFILYQGRLLTTQDGRYVTIPYAPDPVVNDVTGDRIRVLDSQLAPFDLPPSEENLQRVLNFREQRRDTETESRTISNLPPGGPGAAYDATNLRLPEQVRAQFAADFERSILPPDFFDTSVENAEGRDAHVTLGRNAFDLLNQVAVGDPPSQETVRVVSALAVQGLVNPALNTSQGLETLEDIIAVAARANPLNVVRGDGASLPLPVRLAARGAQPGAILSVVLGIPSDDELQHVRNELRVSQNLHFYYIARGTVSETERRRAVETVDGPDLWGKPISDRFGIEEFDQVALLNSKIQKLIAKKLFPKLRSGEIRDLGDLVRHIVVEFDRSTEDVMDEIFGRYAKIYADVNSTDVDLRSAAHIINGYVARLTPEGLDEETRQLLERFEGGYQLKRGELERLVSGLLKALEIEATIEAAA